MTLRRRLAYQLAAMIVGLLLVSGAAVWGVLALRHSYAAALSGYEDLRRVYAVGSHVATARTLVSLSRHGEPAALTEMRSAYQLMNAQAPMGSGPGSSSTHHGTIRKGVLELIRTLEARIASPAQQNEPINLALFVAIEQSVASLAAGVRAEIQQAQDVADARRRTTIFTVAAVCVTVIVAAVLLGASQYRGVMGPLTELSAAVRRIAGGDFSARVPTVGPTEFATLAADFNRTAQELESLYRELEEKVAQKSRQLVRSERLASVGHLAAGVAHEINNPLGIIAGHAEFSLRQLGSSPGNDDLRHTLQTIADEAFRCKSITDMLLSMARPGDEDRRVVALEDVARSVLSLLATLPENRNRTVTLDVQAGIDTRVLASEAEMKQVLLNLTKNALESLPSDAGVVTLSVTRPDAKHVALSVADTGRGIPADVLEHVFEPFFTTKRGAGSPGTGLGLSISHAIVQSHQGSLAARSAGAGTGATFTLTLPGVPSPAPEAVQHSLSPVLGAEGGTRGVV